ncbi:uncharacterized protein JN550_006411 [Neoarthrinium moseri]|uniref:uncharacterized protein n=1 Tax=Neoarthrinium moseri TaxID=1658444 RepID=UPI001FDB9580|nr:uncharacterized protein JN550_006411 [Neoarthrinium moseri]KAI1868495.1 hypothetical protein JN550_006411 [Neoarthrinium moseri]
MSRKKIEPASLINSVLRTFPQPENGFTPNGVYKEPKYTFTNSYDLYISGDNLAASPSTEAKKHFDNMRKAGWTANWIDRDQKDHFVEVQHVVDLLAGGPLGQGQWLKASFQQYLHLAWYQNDRRNTWNIPTSLNIRKGKILLFQYIQSGQLTRITPPSGGTPLTDPFEAVQLNFLAEYLFCFNKDKSTPFLQLMELSVDMATCEDNDVTKLTRYVGKRIFDELVKAFLSWSASRGDERYDRRFFDQYYAQRSSKRLALETKDCILEFTTANLVDGQ